MKKFIGLFLWMIANVSFAVQDTAGPTIVVSILPLYHIAQAVMGKHGQVILLIPQGASEHAYTLKPSQYEAIKNADVVMWIGPELETFLVDALAQVPVKQQMKLISAPSMIRYEMRIDDQHEGETTKEANADPHLWLDPLNAITIARQLEKRVSTADPVHQKIYRRQLGDFTNKIAALNIALDKQLSPLQSVPFVTFHDAFQYFEKRYSLRRLDSISTNPHIPFGAGRWMEMSLLLKSEHIPCIFSEPQNQTDLLKQLATENHAKLGLLDPMGTFVPAGTEGYSNLLTSIADSMVACLK